MEPKRLFCQDCGLKFDNVSSYKMHALGSAHQQQVAQLFHTVPHNGQVNFPHFILESLSKPNSTDPVIGLQLMSLCVSTAMGCVPFYVCHACQEKCQSRATLFHHKSTEHYFSVFACMNPERLNFGWFHPSEKGLRAKAVEEEKEQGAGVLRVIDIPKKVFENMTKATFSQTMKELAHSDNLKEVLRVDQPERMTLQEYLRNPARTYPLLGLNFLVEYRSIDSNELCGYLCLLCMKRVQQTRVIAHVIGFDHLFWYLERVHPSSLLSKSSYTLYTTKYELMILDLAKKAQEIGNSGDVQEMKLDSDVFAEVHTGSFANALELLQMIRKERNQSDLRPHVTPGQRLVPFKEVAQSPATPLEPVGDQQNMTEPDKAGQCSAVVAKGGKLSCQVCAPGSSFFYMSEYKKHVRGNKHHRRMESLFKTELHRTTMPIPRMVVYEYITNPGRTDPVIGLHLVTVCISAELIKSLMYLCHTCQDKCTSHVIMAHLTSSDHYFCTLAFMDPERLPFGWIPSQDMLSILRPQVQAVEKEQGSGLLQVFDMPTNFIGNTPYLPTMRALCQTDELNERLKVKKWIKLETYLTKPNRKHPILGLDFLVEYRCTKYRKLCGYLCLLCKKRVRETLVIAHIIGFDHLFCYLDLTHPSSLGSKSLYKHYDAQYNSMILDLATQAEKMDSSGKVQRQIELDPTVYDQVDSTEFSSALNKLQMVWEENNQSNFQPLVTSGPRLIPKKQTKALSSKPKNLAQSSEPQKPSQSSDLLWAYLKNKERREPMIGLNAVIECASDNLPPYYLCEACAEKMAQDCIIDHLISPAHRYHYLLLYLDPTQYKEIVSSSIDVALNRLQTIQKVQMPSDLQPLMIPGQRLVTVKEEMVQSQVTPQTLQQVSESTDIQKTVKMQGIVQEPALDLNHTESLFIGEPSQTQASEVLGRYINSKLRKEPIIGLNSFIERHSDNQPGFLECNACSERLAINCVISHLTGPGHRYTYIKSKHPDLLAGWSDNPSLTENLHMLRVMARYLEKKEGCGQFKVLRVGQDSVSEVGPTSTYKVATEKSDVTPEVSVGDPKSTEMKREYPLQKLGASPHFTVAQRSSELSKVIYNNKKKKKKKWRNVIIIGLREVTECSSANQETFYICNVCRVKISKFYIFYHIIGIQHHYNYIKAHYPSWLKQEGKKDHLPLMSRYIMKLAVAVKEKESRIGDVQVLELDVDLYKRLISMPVDSAVNNLQIWKEQIQNKDQTEQKGMKNLQHGPEPTPKQPCLPNPHDGAAKETEEQAGPSEPSGGVDDFRVPPETVTVKQEQMESPACPKEPIQDTPQEPIQVPQPIDTEQVTVKQEQVRGQVCSEEPIQVPQPIDTEQATNVMEVVPSSVAAQKPIQGPEPHDTELFTVRENVTQRPTPPEQSVLGLKSTKIKQAAVGQVEICADLQDPEFTEANTGDPPAPKPDETGSAPLHEEKVSWQMNSRMSLQDPRMFVAKRATIPVGESHLSKFMLSFMTGKREPLIGRGAVVECRSFKQPTFYLCLTCTKKINKNCICNHIISGDHQYCYIESLYPDLIPDWMKNPTDVAWWVEGHEEIWDVQVMKLDLNSYEKVASAPFDLALALLQVIRRERNQSYLQPLVTPGQRLIIVHNWGVPHQEALGMQPQDPSRCRAQSQRGAFIEETVQHQETPFGQEQDSDCIEFVCVSEKRVQSPGRPQKPSQDLKEVERQRVTNVVETAEHGGAHQEPAEEPKYADQAKAVNTKAVPAQASPSEAWPGLKGTEKVPAERVGRSSVDLRAYVEDPQRTQPVVGLNALIECRSDKQPPLYLCVACSTQLNKTPVIDHVIGNKHRLSYLGSRRPDLFMGWNNSQDSATMFSNLMEMAREVECEEQDGVREIQEVSLDSAAYTEVKSMPFDKALNLLQIICKEQDRSDLHPLVTVKQERIEYQACPEQPRQVPQHIDTDQGSAPEEKPTPVEMVTHQECRSGSGAKTPMIGLQLVIECRNVEEQPPPCLYICQACSVKLTGDQRSINKHLSSVQHQYFYIKSCHPSRFETEKKAGRMVCGMTDLVQFVAKKLEEDEGSGSFQVMNMSKVFYEKFKQGNYEECIKMLKGCDSVEEKQTCRKIRERNIIQHTDSAGVTLPYLTAPCGPGKTLQSSGPGSYVSRDSPTTRTPPIVSNRAVPAKNRTKQTAGQRLWPDHLASPGDSAAHRPSTATRCPSREGGPIRPLAPRQPDHVSHGTSKPQSLSSLSPTGPARSPRDTLSHRPAVATELPPVRAASRPHPSQTATSSRAASTRRSGANEDVVQGEQISTVGRLLSPAADKGFSTTGARKRPHHEEEPGDEAPWNYENRQFSSGPCETSVPQSKPSRGVHDPRGSAPPDLHLSDMAPGGRCSSNIVIGLSRMVVEKESPSSRGGLERGAREPVPKCPTSGKAARDLDGESSDQGLKKERCSEDGSSRITLSSSQIPHLTATARPVSATAGRVPQTASHSRKRPSCQSAGTQHKATDGATIRRPSNSSPPVKIPGLDYNDSQESPAERFLTCWKATTGGEGTV
ncbi:hypothetical protein AAFF_G00174650 [Aldrovandia affinis]|uniref:C2H2-type domain-containing protein n=1 Tax=Aldrovandia affinis TaxID=143900 RepID=A0AAD7RL82_9TELE|nr:hypothetical protein AAFF_G00174650 [Aldrovandia affinis]